MSPGSNSVEHKSLAGKTRSGLSAACTKRQEETYRGVVRRGARFKVPVAHVVACAAAGPQVLLQVGREGRQQGVEGPQPRLGGAAAPGRRHALRGSCPAPASVAPGGHASPIGWPGGRGAAHVHAVAGAVRGGAVGAAVGRAPVGGRRARLVLMLLLLLSLHAEAAAAAHPGSRRCYPATAGRRRCQPSRRAPADPAITRLTLPQTRLQRHGTMSLKQQWMNKPQRHMNYSK